MDMGNDGSVGDRNANDKYYSKRHSMYSDDAKLILDKIHSDTEQMIAEITMKYGNLDDPAASLPEHQHRPHHPAQPSKHDDQAASNFLANNPFHPKNLRKLQQEEDAGTFSSDSLEDCSLDLSAGDKCQMRGNRKSICRKKHRKYDSNPTQNTFPKRSVSDYFIYDDYNNFNNPNRNVSLAEILNEDEDKTRKEHALINSQRHSSASFFLAPERRSQESLLSDDLSGCGVSYCNSMESILSDESDCKSAPLEVLFGRTKRDFYRYPGNQYDPSRVDANCSSKSYGSSPNNGTSSFDYYMEHQQSLIAGGYSNDAYNTSNYGCYDGFVNNARNAGRCAAAVLQPPQQFQNKPFVSYAKPIPTSSTFPSISEHSSPKNEEFIPRLGNKNTQYTSQMNRSLSKEFANQRQQNNSNPLYACSSSDDDFFERKPVPSSPSATTRVESAPIDASPPTVMRKSCSFEIEMFHNRGKALQQKSAAKKYEQNLEKFEKDRNRGRGASQFGDTLEMSYVPHKPPVANRRTGSVKAKRVSREKDRYHTVGQIKCSETRPERKPQKSEPKCNNDNSDKSIELYFAENSSVDDDNMDSLELYSKPNLYKENSVDSLDGLGPSRHLASKRTAPNNTTIIADSMVTEDFLSQAEYLKFRDIEKKIDVINKLVEMEEKKLKQERVTKELRMRPFKANAQKKGYVKSLTMNFDNLAKTMQFESDLNQKQYSHNDIKRNYSLPDVLEVAKYQFLSHGQFDGSIRDKVEQFLEGKIWLASTEPKLANEGARGHVNDKMHNSYFNNFVFYILKKMHVLSNFNCFYISYLYCCIIL